MMYKLPKYVITILFTFFLSFAGCQPHAARIVNLAHLEKLCEDVTIQGKPCTIVHIYSDAPDYGWTDASGEGIACIDDAARAAVVYIRASEMLNNDVYVPRIRGLLNFTLMMQAEDGTFYNFINKDLTINRAGSTSLKSFGFWAARGYWALATGYAYFKMKDTTFASQLRAAYVRCLPQLKKLEEQYGNYKVIDGHSYPTWLFNRYAADATSEFLLGAAEFLAIEQETDLQQSMSKLADGLMAMQLMDDSSMYGAFYSWPGSWHTWGNSQIQALAALSSVMNNDQWLQRARIGGTSLLSKLLAGDWVHEYNFADKKFTVYPQIAYGVRTTALGFLQLYRATGDENYAMLAGLAASWLTGNNLSGEPLYDAATGRGYDGIDRKGINRNAGAESTIEALYTLIEIVQVPTAAAWLCARSEQPWGDAGWPQRQDLQRTFIADHARLALTWKADIKDIIIKKDDKVDNPGKNRGDSK